MTELKTCPFCGGEAETVGDDCMEWIAECIECCASSMAFPTEAEAIEAWNARADTEYGSVPATDENMAKHGWVRERTCRAKPHLNLTVGDDFLTQSGWSCSECGGRLDLPVKAYYCPNCGSRVVDGNEAGE